MTKRIAIILFNILVLLLIIEFASRHIIRSEILMYRIFNNTTSMWLTWWQNQPNPGVYSPIYEVDPVLGWKLKSHLHEYSLGENYIYTTQTDGIRKTENVSLEKDSSVIRVALIGDSYTEGTEVSNEYTWAEVLEKEAKGKLEVLNFGVGGYGFDQSLLQLETNVLDYKPDLVLLGFVNCDIERNAVAFRDYAKPMFVLENDSLIKTSVTIRQPEFYQKKHVLKSWSLLNLAINNEEWKGWTYQEDLSTAIILQMKEFCKRNNIDFKIVFIVTPSELIANYDISSYSQKLCENNNIELINTLPAFMEASESGVTLKKDGHWLEKGNEIIALSILNALVGDQ